MFKRGILFLLWVAVIGAGLWWVLAGSKAELVWGADWPRELVVEGQSIEKVLRGPKGPGEGDWARAEERARWKAYYNAQLRAAERLGGLRLSARTEVRDLALADQSLEAEYRGTVRAAAERPDASRVERVGDSVRATVVVAIPEERLVSLRRALLSALRSGKVSLSVPGRPEIRTAELKTVRTPEAASPPEAESVTPAASKPSRRWFGRKGKTPKVKAAEPVEPVVAVAPAAALPEAESTGALLWLASKRSAFGGAPRLFDAAGTELGSIFDLPANRLAAGPPIAAPSDLAEQRAWAGDRPRRYEGRVEGGDIFLDETLDRDEVLRFRGWLRSAKIVVVLDS